MFDRMLRRIRDKVRLSEYNITLHGLDAMEEDGLTAMDVESCLLRGKVAERQRDRRTGESKYVVEGTTIGGHRAAVVAKLSPTRKVVILTVFRT